MVTQKAFTLWSAVLATSFLGLTSCGSSTPVIHDDPLAATDNEPTDPTPEAPPSPPASQPDASAPEEELPVGEPITAPEREWTWIDIPDTECADGSATGLGVNLTKDSDDVLVFLEGGGACWDGTSCWGPVSTSFAIATGYGKLQWNTDPQRAMIYIVDPDAKDNPFAKKNIVYVPYCTGDVFSGDNVTKLKYLGIEHETHFRGRHNMKTYLQRLVATFPKAKRVWLAGDSAGGFGAALNFGVVQEAFKKARVDVIDDSGQPVNPDPETWTKWKAAWNMQLPADCASCADTPTAFVDYYRVKYPNSRFGLISYEKDIVIAPFMSISTKVFNEQLIGLANHFDGVWNNGRYFLIEGSGHVGMFMKSSALKTWITAMVTDDTSWASVRP